MNRKNRKILRNVVVVAIIVCGLTWVCSGFVHLGRVEYTDNAQIRCNLIPVNARVQGYIQRVCFDDFQFVHKGDTLVVIEPAEYELKVVQAQATYQRALMENTAMETVISTTANNLTVSDANIEELRVRLNQTRTDYVRYEQLYAEKAVTRQQYDNAKADYEATKAKYDMLVRSKKSTALSRTSRRNASSRTRPISMLPWPHATLRSSISPTRSLWRRATALRRAGLYSRDSSYSRGRRCCRWSSMITFGS